MYGGRVFEYASCQAGVRARIGAMPDETRWRYIADAADLDNLIDRLRSEGLSHWVKELPRRPDVRAIEDRLNQGLLELSGVVSGLLPARWVAVRRWLRLGAGLVFAGELLREEDPNLPDSVDQQLLDIARFALSERPAALENTAYSRYLGEDISPFDRWFRDFSSHCPTLAGREGYIVRRLQKLVANHHQQIRSAREKAASGTSQVDPDTQWRLRNQLSQNLHDLLGGDPFHAGLVFTYGLLELLNRERCRALLIASARRWDSAQVLRGAA